MNMIRKFENFVPKNVEGRYDRFKSMAKGTLILFYDPNMTLMKGVEMFWSQNNITEISPKTKQIMYDAYMEIHNGPKVDVDSLVWECVPVTGFFWILRASTEDMVSRSVKMEFFNDRGAWDKLCKSYDSNGVINFTGNLKDLNTTTQ